MGLNGTDIPEYKWVEPCLKPDRIVYIGLRDVDAGEKKILRDNSEWLMAGHWLRLRTPIPFPSFPPYSLALASSTQYKSQAAPAEHPSILR